MAKIFCDFDGTITKRDSIVFLTERFGGGPAFRQELLDAIINGTVTVFEAIRIELETVKASWAEVKDVLLSEIAMDPSFPSFVNWCRESGLPLTVLSSGMEPVVDLFIGELGVPFFAHPVEIDSSGWRYRRNPEHDKKNLLQAEIGSDAIIFIGDGTSDVSAVPFADLLYAKKEMYLAAYCDEQGIPYVSFESFSDIQSDLAQRILNNDPGQASAAVGCERGE